jgi:hypothetical protein
LRNIPYIILAPCGKILQLNSKKEQKISIHEICIKSVSFGMSSF